MKRLIPVFLLAALMLTSCKGRDGSSSGKTSTAESETTAAAVTTDAETQSTAPTTGSKTEQTAASAASTAESATVSGSVKSSETSSGGSSSVIGPGETAEEDESVVIITIPADSPEGNDADGIIVNDDGSLILPPVQNSDND